MYLGFWIMPVELWTCLADLPLPCGFVLGFSWTKLFNSLKVALVLVCGISVEDYSGFGKTCNTHSMRMCEQDRAL